MSAIHDPCFVCGKNENNLTILLFSKKIMFLTFLIYQVTKAEMVMQKCSWANLDCVGANRLWKLHHSQNILNPISKYARQRIVFTFVSIFELQTRP